MIDDLISRQAAIDAVASYLYKVCLAFHSCMTHEESKECATLILQPVPSATQSNTHNTLEQRWIPCSERLPEKVGRYLVTCEKWGAWSVDWNIWIGEPKSWLWEQGVTAWMPLPEPYRGDGDENGR